jgi:hypothetical protein
MQLVCTAFQLLCFEQPPDMLSDCDEAGDCTCKLEMHIIALAAVRDEAQLPTDALPSADHDRLLQYTPQLEPVHAKPGHIGAALWIPSTT